MYITISTDFYGGRFAFEKARQRAEVGRLAGFVTRAPRMLHTLEHTRRGGRYAGRQNVPVRLIRGTESRQSDFDINFNPLRTVNPERWVGIFSAWMRGAILPPIELVKSGNTYFVRDGHHRISVARALGLDCIEAFVTELE